MASTGYKNDPRAVTSVEGRTGAIDLTLDDVGGTDAIDDAVDAALGTQVDEAIETHAEAVDPHGDRAYADGEIATLASLTATGLAGKANTSHAHAAGDVTSGTLAIGRIPVGTTSSTVAQGDHAHGGVYADASHTHAGADITSGTVPFTQMPTGATGSTVAVGNHNHDSAYSATGHNHTGTYAPLAHSHAGSDITSGTVPIGQLPTGTGGTNVALGNHNHTGTYANASHTHSGADITSGTVPVGQLPTGTSGTTVALGNHTHGVATGGTGLTTVTANSYLKGNGTSALVERTYAQVKTDIGLDAGAWTAPDSYAANMSNAGSPYYDVGSRTEPNNIARLRGRIAAGANYTAGATICTLNASARPAMEVAFPVRVVGVGAANGSLTITTGGLVTYSANITVGAATAWLLDGITYTLAA